MEKKIAISCIIWLPGAEEIRMATYMALPLLILAVLSSGSSADALNADLLGAIEEMKAANYFSFVMLINMSPPDLIQGNLTFFMPDDSTLSKIVLPTMDISGFVLRHSIPKPLLFDYLEHIPTGSLIPTSAPEFAVRINNQGTEGFFLNNVRITRPDVCVVGFSIRCHGINGVLEATRMREPPPTNCSHEITIMPTQPLSAPTSDAVQASPSSFPAQAPAHPHAAADKSASPQQLCAAGLVKSLLCTIIALMIEFLVNFG